MSYDRDVRTETIEYIVRGSLDGTTVTDPIRVGMDDTTGNPSQIFTQETDDLGVLDVNLDEELVTPARGNRVLIYAWISGPNAGSASSELALYDLEEGRPTRRQRRIASLAGRQELFIQSGQFIPHGSSLVVSGLESDGSTPVIVRYCVGFVERPADYLQLLDFGGDDGGGGDCPCLRFGAGPVTEAGDYQLQVGQIQTYDASALADGQMRFLFPSQAIAGEQVGIKEVGNSAVEVTCNGNGPPIELPTSPPIFPGGNIGIPRGFWLWQYDQSNDVWRLR